MAKYRFLEDFYAGNNLTGVAGIDSPKEMQTRHFGKRLLHRIAKIKRTESDTESGKVVVVQLGEVGGWVESMDNLSQTGECWVAGNSIVCGDAFVCGDVQVSGDVEIGDNAIVRDDATVEGSVAIGENAYVYGDAEISGGDRMAVSGRARVDGKISDMARVAGSARICENGEVSGNALVGGRTIINGGVVKNTSICASQPYIQGKVYGDTCVLGNPLILEGAEITSDSVVEGGTIAGDVGYKSIVGSRILDYWVEAYMPILAKIDYRKEYTMEQVHELFKSAVDDFVRTEKRLARILWDYDSSLTEGAHGLYFGYYNTKKPYSVKEKWLYRLLPYDEYKSLAVEYGLEPDRNGYIRVACWFDEEGKIQPIGENLFHLREWIYGSGLNHIGAGACPFMEEGEIKEGTMLVDNSFYKGTAKGINYLCGNSQMEGKMDGEFNAIAGNSVFSGTVSGKSAAFTHSMMFGTSSGRNYPDVRLYGDVESQLRSSILGEDAQLIGKFYIVDSIIDGNVVGNRKVKGTNTEEEVLVSVYDQTYLLKEEQGLLMRYPTIKEDGEKTYTVVRSIPKKSINRFTDNSIVGGVDSVFEYTDGKGIGYYETLDYIKGKIEKEQKEYEQRLEEIEKQKTIARLLEEKRKREEQEAKKKQN